MRHRLTGCEDAKKPGLGKCPQFLCGFSGFYLWAWADDDLRKKEKKNDTITVFKRRVIASCESYPSKLALVPSMAGRMSKCVRRRGASIGK